MESADKDAETGLLSRAGFLAELHKSQADQTQIRRGCLLILHFPVLQQIRDKAGDDAARIALCNLLGIIETRIRSRDLIGRIRPFSLGIFLRRCREADAVLIADQYVRLLRDVMLDAGEHFVAMDMHYRIVALDWRGRRRRQGVSRSIRSRNDSTQVLSMLRSPTSSTDADKIVSLNETEETSANTPGAGVEQSSSANSKAAPVRLVPSTPRKLTSASGEEVAASGRTLAGGGYRLRPGMVLAHRPLICCYRVHALNARVVGAPSPDNALFDAVFSALSLDGDQQRAPVDNLIIVPVDATRLTSESAVWLKEICRQRRVAPSDICLSVHINAVSRELRSTLPAIRGFNRQGIMMMLEGVENAVQFSAMSQLAGFEYLLISSRLLRDSLQQIRVRKELEALLEVAGKQQRQLCTNGVDTPSLLAHAKSMNMEVGFGRQCGRSLAFPLQHR